MRSMIFATALLFAVPAQAACDIYGNCYTVTPNYGYGQQQNSYNVQGFSTRSGQTWNHTVDQQGQRGFDGDGNYYTYDRNTGNYMNFGTGRICTGTGYARVCN